MKNFIKTFIDSIRYSLSRQRHWEEVLAEWQDDDIDITDPIIYFEHYYFEPLPDNVIMAAKRFTRKGNKK